MIRACITGLAVRNALKPAHLWGFAALLYARLFFLFHSVLFRNAGLKALMAQLS